MNAPASVDGLTNDAAALVKVAAPHDWPGGFVVVADRLPPRIRGLSVGCGDHLAATYGCRPGVRGVLVDVAQIVAVPHAPTRVELATLDAIVCHEAAHALTMDPKGTPEAVEALLDATGTAVGGYDAGQVARQHCPRWAAAFWLLAERAGRFRGHRAATMLAIVAEQLAVYGYAAGDVERVTRGADAERPVREVLAAGSPAAALLASMLPNVETRAAAIVAAGIVGVGSNTEGHTNGCVG